MMYARTTIIGLIVCGALGFAQQRRPGNAGPGLRTYPPGGKVVSEVFTVGVFTFGQLVRMSELIVDVTVISASGISTSPDPDVPGVETHSVMAINEVLFGTVPYGSPTILLRQLGGKAGKWDVTVEGDELVTPGERYILFLLRGKSKEMPAGPPHYVVAGVWSGQAKVVNGKIKFPPGAHPRLHEYDNKDVSAFLQEAKETIRKEFPLRPRP